MRVAFVSLETVHHRETETNARLDAIADALVDRGHDVHVLCARWWEGEHPRFDRDGISYHGVAANAGARSSFFARLPFAIRTVNPDVVHASATPPFQALPAAWGGTLAGVPTVLEWYDGVAGGRWAERAATSSELVVTPSRLVSTWAREAGADGSRVDVVPNPIDAELVRRVEPGDPTEVVYARRLDGSANLESPLLALAELRDREWSATVIGDGPERERYERLAGDVRIDDRVRFVGEADRRERLAIYRGAHVFVQTARRCVFPTELLWGLAAGCVGVVEYHADSSAHELVEGFDRGFRTTTERELTDAIVAAGELERRTYDERFERFDERAVYDRYVETYRGLCERYG